MVGSMAFMERTEMFRRSSFRSTKLSCQMSMPLEKEILPERLGLLFGFVL